MTAEYDQARLWSYIKPFLSLSQFLDWVLTANFLDLSMAMLLKAFSFVVVGEPVGLRGADHRRDRRQDHGVLPRERQLLPGEKS